MQTWLGRQESIYATFTSEIQDSQILKLMALKLTLQYHNFSLFLKKANKVISMTGQGHKPRDWIKVDPYKQSKWPLPEVDRADDQMISLTEKNPMASIWQILTGRQVNRKRLRGEKQRSSVWSQQYTFNTLIMLKVCMLLTYTSFECGHWYVFIFTYTDTVIRFCPIT